MGRIYEAVGVSKAITASAGNLIWTPTEIDPTGLVGLTFGWEELAAATTVCGPNNRCTAFRIKQGNRLMYDISYAQLQAYAERFAHNNTKTGGTAVVDTAVTGRCVTLMLNAPWRASIEAADECQVMPDQGIQVEVEVPAVASSTGYLHIHAIRSTQKPSYYKTLLRSPCGQGASTRRGRVPLQNFGQLTALSLPVAYLQEVEVFVQGGRKAQIYGRDNAVFEAAAGANPDFLQGVEEWNDNTALAADQWYYFGGGDDFDLAGGPNLNYLLWTHTASGTAAHEYVVETLVPIA